MATHPSRLILLRYLVRGGSPGPPDVENEEESVKTLSDPVTQRKLAEQSVAFEGRRGALLVAVSPSDGQKLAAYRLASMPRFDGMIAAGGQLYLSTVEGKVICIAAGEGQPLPEGRCPCCSGAARRRRRSLVCRYVPA